MKLSDIISSEERWTQGAYARNSQGSLCPCYFSEAVSFCLMGGIYKLTAAESDLISKELENLLRGIVSSKCENGTVEHFNDHATWPQVQEIIAEFDLCAEKILAK